MTTSQALQQQRQQQLQQRLNYVLQWAATAAVVAVIASLAGCTAPPPAATGTGAATTDTAGTSSSASRPPPTGASVAGQARTFSTQLATYTSVGFDSVPGWSRDDFSESWPAFLGSCKVLTGRGAEWKEVCDRALKVDGKNNNAIRGFFEGEFSAYQIRDDDRKPDGVVTGYFEPEIAGARQYGAPFIYPVYGQPDDMLFADARKLPAGNGTVAARVEGRNVVVQTGLSTRDMGAPGLFALDLSAISRDTLDRKVRLRVEGKQLLPYYTREEIETKGAPNAKVLAFVSSATALYEMQIQGSGRIKLANGDIVRVAYAEQNGQPFRPTLAQAANGKPRSPVKVRGSSIELQLDDGDDDDVGAVDSGTIRTRGFTLARPVASGPVVVPGRRAAGAVSGSGIKDPSYVFFKESTSPVGGPVGAFGVPLSAGRSIAVDPRSTPLGYPVFVSTRTPGSGAPMQRLTIAQDTGGAIRGAVRADYFFGNGQQAATNARRMKERGQLWILLPRGLAVAQAAVSSAIRTRGGPVGANLPQCLVPSEGSCVDD
ncbi:membrane-bound lytic murein transglycosylase A [Variovorax sp. YR634]|jgi:membrane-bound lytic murein transglycosylase A|uniref:murein transglycosylase A n=1 Tax=Variovorax sp. YR634 TaxID=1884385 RepID=UPI00089D3D87|nr:MltA domain-containing protein [Variovorax sp. YR634]SDZ24650.1 membrane-bound lytic murein transglycosylase A [Variovorax sp. YR634]